ncbi:AI-2E family transporter [Candidatus Shapirobacteria bacterium]|nr:AI-2E family transporter [Candidatus Shapirobacteria bacterium]
MKPQRIEISFKTILFTIGSLLSLWLIWQIKDILVLFFICFILMEALNPTIEYLEKFKIPRAVSILLIYSLLIAVISVSIASIVPLMIEQTTGLIRALPEFFKNFSFFGFTFQTFDWTSQLKLLETLPSDIARTAVQVFSNIFSGFVMLVITFYLLMERRHFDNHSFKFFGFDGHKKVIELTTLLEKKLGNWVGAQLFLMFTIGALSYIGYLMIGLHYAIPLAIIAGLLEIVPNIGPTVATVMAFIVGFTVSPTVGIMAIIVGLIIQQLENNLIVPKVMQGAMGLNPLVTILAIAIGAQLGGVLGAILAIPTYIVIETIIQIFWLKK